MLAQAAGFSIRCRWRWSRSDPACRLKVLLDYAAPAPPQWSREMVRLLGLSVSNSSSGRRWKLDHAPAVGDPTHMVEFGTGRRAFAREA